MIDKLSERLGGPRIVFSLLVLYLLNQLAIGLVLAEARDDILPLQLAFTLENYQAIVSTWSAEQGQSFVRHFYLDFYHPFLYAFFLFSALSYFKSRGKFEQRWFLLLPFVAGFLDLTENVLHLTMHLQSLPTNSATVFLSSLAASVKWTLAGASVLLVAYYLFKPARKEEEQLIA